VNPLHESAGGFLFGRLRFVLWRSRMG